MTHYNFDPDMRVRQPSSNKNWLWWFLSALGALVIAVIVILSLQNTPDPVNQVETPPTQVEAAPNQTEVPVTKEEAATTTPETPASEVGKPVQGQTDYLDQPVVVQTESQKEALKKAEAYTSDVGYSYDGLVAQLEQDKFSHEDAVYATVNMGVDWGSQAALKAQNYLNVAKFNKDEMIQKLVQDKFTTG